MHRRSRSLLAAALLVIALAACSGDDATESEVKDRVADQAVDSGLDREAADCYADVVVDEVGADNLKDVDFSADEPPEEMQLDIASAAQKALTECDIEGSSLDG